jgi:hypothetical protein
MNDPKPTTRKDGSTGLEARGYKWEDFTPEHVKSMIHGAYSPRVVEAVARIVQSEVTEQAPWLLQPIFGDSLARYARAEARARLLSDHILRVCDEQGAHKVPQKLWESATSSDNTASKMASELGITPLARAKLAALTTSAETGAASLESLRARGAEIIAARQSRIAAEADDQDDA